MMGMYDEVFFDVDLPDSPAAGHLFRTKSLDGCMDRYTVTKAGRLCLVGSVMFEDGPFVTAPADLEKLDIGFHGDILLRSLERESGDYVARFTDGTLQWVGAPLDHPAGGRVASVKVGSDNAPAPERRRIGIP